LTNKNIKQIKYKGLQSFIQVKNLVADATVLLFVPLVGSEGLFCVSQWQLSVS